MGLLYGLKPGDKIFVKYYSREPDIYPAIVLDPKEYYGANFMEEKDNDQAYQGVCFIKDNGSMDGFSGSPTAGRKCLARQTFANKVRYKLGLPFQYFEKIV